MSPLDPITGTPADQAVRYGLDGVVYEVHLTNENAAELRSAIGRYIAVSKRIGGRRGARPPANLGNAVVQRDARLIRLWWRQQGNEISSRGIVPAHVIEAYRKAHGKAGS